MSRAFRLRLAFVSLAGVAGAIACTNTELYVPDAGEFRGITIPLPPPSYVGADTVSIDVSGNVNHDPLPGTYVALWESESAEGRLVAPEDNGDFLFEAVEVVPNQSCLELWSEHPQDGEIVRSSEARYKVVIIEGDPACGMDELCSPPDADGNCLCLDLRFDNC